MQGYHIGVKQADGGLQLALINEAGERIDQLVVRPGRRYFISALRQWVKHKRADMGKSLFYVDSPRLVGHEALEFVQEQGWDVRHMDRERLVAQHPLSNGREPDAAYLVSCARRSPALAPAAPRVSKAELRLVQLRERRAELSSWRTECSTRLQDANGRWDASVKREFDRMELRHVRILDKFIQRLDLLISLELEHAGE